MCVLLYIVSHHCLVSVLVNVCFCALSSNRYYVLHKLPELTFLDSKPVSNSERKEAKRVGAFMRVVRPSSDTVSKISYLCHT